MFAATDTTGFVTKALSDYQILKERIESAGLVLPELLSNPEVNVDYEEEGKAYLNAKLTKFNPEFFKVLKIPEIVKWLNKLLVIIKEKLNVFNN